MSVNGLWPLKLFFDPHFVFICNDVFKNFTVYASFPLTIYL